MFREMRRARQQLSTGECEEVLAAEKRGVLCVNGLEGYPYGVPVDYVFLDGKLYFHGALAGHKVDALAANDSVCFTVFEREGRREEGAWWYHVRSVVCFGHARPVEDEDVRMRSLRALGRKYMPTDDLVEREIARDAARCLVLEMTIDHMTGKAVREK